MIPKPKKKATPKPTIKSKGFEISLPGGGTKNSITGKITPPKVTPKPLPMETMSSKQYDAHLKKVLEQMKKGK